MIAKILALMIIIVTNVITTQQFNSAQKVEKKKVVCHHPHANGNYKLFPFHARSIFDGVLKGEMRSSTFKRHKSSLKGRHDIQFHGKSDAGKQHEIIIAVVQSNLDQLEEIVLDISNPDSVNFGTVRTRDEIIAITNHSESCDIITSFLKRTWRDTILDVKIEESNFGEFIKGNLYLFIKCVIPL